MGTAFAVEQREIIPTAEVLNRDEGCRPAHRQLNFRHGADRALAALQTAL
jgi:hypothetical protein